MNKLLRSCTRVALTAGLGFSLAALAPAQKVAAVPQLDLGRLTGVWFEQAHLPDKWEKRCVSDGAMLFALNDKDHSFQQGTFCRVAGGNIDSRNDSGKLDKSGNGILKVRHLVIFSIKLHVLAAGPGFQWILLGTPNHKTLTLLSREVTVAPATYAQMETIARGEGFKTAKLIRVTHPAGDYHPHDKANQTSSSPSTTPSPSASSPTPPTPATSPAPSTAPSAPSATPAPPQL